MPLCFLSPPPPPLITCRVSQSAVRTSPSPSPAAPPPSLSLSVSPNSTAPPSPTCALHCPHFEACSGCTHEFNLHRPAIVDEATEFFKTRLSDFTFDSCKLDCEDLLSSKTWRLEKAHGFNFFPGTQSIEVLAVFKRGQGVSPKKKKSGKKKKKGL